MVRTDNPSGGFVLFKYGTTTIGSITTASGGTVTVYNTSSDARVKIKGDPFDPGNIFDLIEVHNFTWNYPGIAPFAGVGVFAQELHAVAPRLVSPGDAGAGSPGDEGFQMWQTPVSEPLSMVFAELKSLRARVAILEAK
jgi:hypothetical protein